jgi:molybdopterin converting factor subunit 1
MNACRVLLFAQIRESAGDETISVELAPGATVADLRQALVHRLPSSASLILQSMVAVNESYVPDDFVLSPSDEIACIPPVSGG